MHHRRAEGLWATAGFVRTNVDKVFERRTREQKYNAGMLSSADRPRRVCE